MLRSAPTQVNGAAFERSLFDVNATALDIVDRLNPCPQTALATELEQEQAVLAASLYYRRKTRGRPIG